MTDALKDYPIVTEIPVAWGEMDALNHVNNVVYFRYFETARIDYFDRIAMMEEIPKTKVGPVLGETSCKYFRPVTYPDTLLIGSRIVDLGDDRFEMEYAVFSKQQQKLTTKGWAKVVMFDFANNCKAQLSDSIKAAIEEIEGQ
ncbi:acyl-CoA thioesterase [Veronia pacifica]|uniref:acyl-CoA thioesterase n=1 Tax=Veronia pacifica TaxID=1080227 RepID=UPI000B20F456|nr:acyl-CoA thioesterase [Veronia pacifica]